MTILSLREAWSQRYGDVDLHTGLRTNVHPFYTVVSDSLPASTLPQRQRAFPCRSLSEFIEELACPRSFVPTRARSYDYPSDASPGWTDHINGVTHDSDNWYFAQRKILWKFPVSHDLNVDVDGRNFTTAGIDTLPKYDHFGDMDFYADKNGNFIYIAVEGHDNSLLPIIAIYDQNLSLRGKAGLHASQGMSGPWCAINPRNGLLYSSQFNDSPGPIILRVYERVFNTNGLTLTYLGAMELFDAEGNPLYVRGIQGATFSPRGHLYLVIDTSDGGIMGFDLVRGRRFTHRLVDYQPNPQFHVEAEAWLANLVLSVTDPIVDVAESVISLLGGSNDEDDRIRVPPPQNEELEGITFWDLADGQAPRIHGQLHLIMSNLDITPTNDDDLYFKHYEVEFPEDRGKV